MNLREYQEEVKRTCATDDKDETIKMALVGMSDELGEIVEPLMSFLQLLASYSKIAGSMKKMLWHGHEMRDMQEELGDHLWYLANFANALHVDLNEVLQENVVKLQKRYPDGFSQEKSIKREEEH